MIQPRLTNFTHLKPSKLDTKPSPVLVTLDIFDLFDLFPLASIVITTT